MASQKGKALIVLIVLTVVNIAGTMAVLNSLGLTGEPLRATVSGDAETDIENGQLVAINMPVRSEVDNNTVVLSVRLGPEDSPFAQGQKEVTLNKGENTVRVEFENPPSRSELPDGSVSISQTLSKP